MSKKQGRIAPAPSLPLEPRQFLIGLVLLDIVPVVWILVIERSGIND